MVFVWLAISFITGFLAEEVDGALGWILLIICSFSLISAVVTSIRDIASARSKPVSKLDSRPEPSKPTPKPEPKPAQEPAKPKGKFCRHCGSKVGPDDIYCIECGNRVQQ